MDMFWFVPSMGDETRLGDPDGAVPPSPDHLIRVARAAEAAGFKGMLVPTGEMCHDSWITAATLAQHTEHLRFLVAFRPGFVSPPVAARQAASLDRMSGGRLMLNVVTGGHPAELAKDGDFLRDETGWSQPGHAERYERTEEFLDVVMKSWHDDGFVHDGRYFHVENGGIEQTAKQHPHPPIYFGGSSDAAMRIAAEYADVYLMWGEPVDRLRERAAEAKQMAVDLGRTLRVGTRFQLVVRSSDDEARDAADDLVGAIDDTYRTRIRDHADKTDSVGQARQNELQGDEWLTDVLWNGFARARMGASVALVGSGPSIKAELDEFVDAGIDTFILSGYRHDQEAVRAGELLLPLLDLSA